MAAPKKTVKVVKPELTPEQILKDALSPEPKKEEKTPAAPKAAEKKEAAPKAVAKKPVAVKAEPVKNAVEKKPAEKKPVAKKTAAKKPVKKADQKSVLHVQFSGKSYSQEELVKMAQDVWKYDLKQKVRELATIELYVKPEENKVYYVMNQEFTGDFNI